MLRSLKYSTSAMNLHFKLIRTFTEDSHSFLSGGLEKLQGGLKEENYFYRQNNELMLKIRRMTDDKTRPVKRNSNWQSVKKALKTTVSRSLLRDMSCLSRHKNCREELYFYNEQMDCTRLILNRLKASKALTPKTQQKYNWD